MQNENPIKIKAKSKSKWDNLKQKVMSMLNYGSCYNFDNEFDDVLSTLKEALNVIGQFQWKQLFLTPIKTY